MSKYQNGQQVCKPCLDLLVAEEDREGKTTLALSLIFQFARDIDPSYKGGEGWGRGEEGRVVVRQGLVWQRVIEPELRSAYLPYWSDCRVVNPGKASVTRETCWFVVTSHPNRIRNVIPPCNCQTQHHYARSQQYQEHKIYGLQKQQKTVIHPLLL